MGKTVLKFYVGGGNGAFEVGAAEWLRPKANPAITGGATKGSTTVSVPNTSSVVVGRMIRIEQANPDFVHSLNGATNNMSFMFKVISKTATTVSFSPALPFTLTNSPALAVYGDWLLEKTGFEDLTFDMENSSAACAVFLQQAYGCWFKGVEVRKSNAKQLWLVCCSKCEIRQCYTHETRSSGPNHEGIDLYEDCCWNLIENNTCVRGGFPMIILGDWKGGCSGNVIAYNYCSDIDTGSEIAGGDISVNHGPHNMMNLFEGNVGCHVSVGRVFWIGEPQHGIPQLVFRRASQADAGTANRGSESMELLFQYRRQRAGRSLVPGPAGRTLYNGGQ